MKNASVVIDPTNKQIVSNGGPSQIQRLVNSVGKQTTGIAPTDVTLSTGARVIAKPSSLHVPPWQMGSAVLGGVPLRVASSGLAPEIYSTTARTPIGWRDASLGQAGAVDIATTANGGGSTRKTTPLTIFGDMNQEGALRKNYAHRDQQCSSSQNGRGEMFFVLRDRTLWQNMTGLLADLSAPDTSPKTSGQSE